MSALQPDRAGALVASPRERHGPWGIILGALAHDLRIASAAPSGLLESFPDPRGIAGHRFPLALEPSAQERRQREVSVVQLDELPCAMGLVRQSLQTQLGNGTDTG